MALSPKHQKLAALQAEMEQQPATYTAHVNVPLDSILQCYMHSEGPSRSILLDLFAPLGINLEAFNMVEDKRVVPQAPGSHEYLYGESHRERRQRLQMELMAAKAAGADEDDEDNNRLAR